MGDSRIPGMRICSPGLRNVPCRLSLAERIASASSLEVRYFVFLRYLRATEGMLSPRERRVQVVARRQRDGSWELNLFAGIGFDRCVLDRGFAHLNQVRGMRVLHSGRARRQEARGWSEPSRAEPTQTGKRATSGNRSAAKRGRDKCFLRVGKCLSRLCFRGNGTSPVTNGPRRSALRTGTSGAWVQGSSRQAAKNCS